MAHKTSWRDVARSHISGHIANYLKETDPADDDFIKGFKALLKEKYPWQTCGWAYSSWLKEKAIAIAYLKELQAKGEPGEFISYSLARLGNQHHLAREGKRPELVSPGQTSLF